MKTILTFLAIANSVVACQNASADVFTAVVQVESRGNANAVGDGGAARGYVQAHRGAWADACEWLGVKWDYATGVKDIQKCRAVFFAYTSRYGARTDEQLARCWNSGPAWAKKYKLTNQYWGKVKAALAAERK